MSDLPQNLREILQQKDFYLNPLLHCLINALYTKFLSKRSSPH